MPPSLSKRKPGTAVSVKGSSPYGVNFAPGSQKIPSRSLHYHKLASNLEYPYLTAEKK